MQQKKKFNYMNVLLILVFIVGLGILLYPNISNYFNERNSSKATAEYDETVAQLNEQERQQFISASTDYNEKLIDNPVGRFADMTESQQEEYNSTLNVDGKGMMCYLKIDKLGVNLPVYHGTTEDVLQHYVGHVEGSSLPTGGIGTHCALSGHRGLPSAVLFTNLDRVEVGDYFTIIVLGEEHVYQVDQISTVLPDDLSPLAIDKEKDYCTLITCTPYGVNTHRLMVRGVRIPDEETEDIDTTGDGNKFDLTREQVVNIVATTMTLGFSGILFWIFLVPVTRTRGLVLRPWDDNIEKVIASAIKVSETATRANWEVEKVTQEADKLASLRRWDETMDHKEALSESDEDRPWNNYQYEEELNQMSEDEEKNFREWDNDVLEKVDQDWSPLDGDHHRNEMRFSDIKNILDRGKVDPPDPNKKEYFEKEMERGKEILKRSKKNK